MTQTQQVPKCVICQQDAFELMESREYRQKNPSATPKYFQDRSSEGEKYNCSRHAMASTYKRVKDNEQTVNQILQDVELRPFDTRRIEDLGKQIDDNLERVMLQTAMANSSRRVLIAKTAAGAEFLNKCEGLINGLENGPGKESLDKRAAELAESLRLLNREHTQANFGTQNPQAVAENFYRGVQQLFADLTSFKDRASDINDALEELRRLKGGAEAKAEAPAKK